MKEIEINEDTRIAIGEGMKVTMTNDAIQFEREQKFKDGDILAEREGTVCILRGEYNNGNFNHYISFNHKRKMMATGICRWSLPEVGWHLATETEKQKLFDEMTKHSLTWDAKGKKVVRWRAKRGEMYCYIDSCADILACREDYYDDVHSLRYDLGNYFHYEDKERQESAAMVIKKSLNTIWEDLPKCEDS